MKWLAALVLLGLCAVVPAAPRYAGTYSGDGGNMVVELQESGGQYTGAIKKGDQSFPLAGALKGETLAGSFEAGGSKFDFSASLEGKVLTLKTGSATYVLEKNGAPNPLDNPLDKPTDKPSDKPKPASPLGAGETPKPDPLSRGKIYKHATGGTFGYPADWIVKETDAGVQLIPPDAAKNAQGPTEAYMIVAMAADGVQRGDDPRIAQALEAYIGQQMPFLQRVGKVESIAAGDQPGCTMAWEGASPLTREPIAARVYAVVLQKQAVFLVGIGEKKLVAGREAVMKDVFRTMAWGRGQVAKELVGDWYYFSYSGSTAAGVGTNSREVRRHARLGEDGACAIQGNVETYLSAKVKDSGGNETAHGSVAGQSGNVVKGKWSAGDGRLYVFLEDGSFLSWRYSIKDQNGNKIMTLEGDGKPEEWSAKKLF